jgi:hypothetical protein
MAESRKPQGKWEMAFDDTKTERLVFFALGAIILGLAIPAHFKVLEWCAELGVELNSLEHVGVVCLVVIGTFGVLSLLGAVVVLVGWGGVGIFCLVRGALFKQDAEGKQRQPSPPT